MNKLRKALLFLFLICLNGSVVLLAEEDLYLKYKTLVQQFPDNPVYHYNLGIILAERGNLSEAEKEVEKAAELEEKPEFYYSLGMIRKDLGKVDEAIVSFKKALSLKPDYVDVFLPLARLLHKKGKDDEALRYLESGLILAPDNVDMLMLDARISGEMGLFSRTINDLKHVVQIDPSNLEAHYFLYQVYFNLGNFDLALKEIFFVETLDPRNYKVYLEKGRVLQKMKRYSESRKALEKAIKLNPGCSICYSILAMDLYFLKDYAGALLNFKKSLQIHYDETVASNYSKLLSYISAVTLDMMNGSNLDKAEKYARLLVQVEPANPSYMVLLGMVLLNKGECEESIRILSEAVEKEYSKPEVVYYNQGICYFKLGKYNEAEKVYEKVVRKRPDFAEAWYNLGSTYEKEGKKEKAILAYLRFISLKPDSTLVPLVKHKISVLRGSLTHTSTSVDGQP